MSFTSNEDGNDEQALLNLIQESKKNQGKAKKVSDKTEKKGEKASKKSKHVEVNFNNDELSNFNVNSKKLINNNEESLNKLFVTEDANAVLEQFEKEKEADIEGQLGN